MSYNISPGQVQKIKTLAKIIWGDPKHPEYYEMLRGQAQVKSCKDLRGPKIDLVIRHLERCAGQGPADHTMSQKDYIRYLWNRVSRAPSGRPREQALRRFLQARFGISDVEFLDQQTGAAVIEALKAMKKRRSAGGDACATRTPAPPDAYATKEERQ